MVRPCTVNDLDDLMDLQKKISAGMERKEWFVETSRSENEKFFEKPNQVFGVYEKERLVAYGTIGFLEDDEGNYGWELGWTEEKVHTCANLDTIVVDPDFRGRGLQRLLIRKCVDHAKKVKPGGMILTTICPSNVYSLRNAQKEGFEILAHKKLYGGKSRYILGKRLAFSEVESDSVYKVYEIECQKCKHKFMWIEGSDIRTSYSLYKRKGISEELISTYCPECNTEVVPIKEVGKGFSVQDESIEVVNAVRGL